MTKLEKIRQEIDKLDEMIIPLLEKRFTLAQELTELKTTLTDKKREKEILDKIPSLSIRKIYLEIFSQSKKAMLKNSLHHFSGKILPED